MTVQSLMQRCAELGIKLRLKADDDDRLLVDAPKGTLTAPLREALAAHKLELIAILKTSDQEPSLTLVPTPSQASEAKESRAPSSTWNSLEATPLISEPPLSATHIPINPPDVEVKKLVSGSPYDENVIDAKDPAARQIVAAQLLAALGGRYPEQHEHARRAFINHGYFDETTKQLRTGDSPAERAAAARKLGVVRSPMATAHLLASLHDSAPEVRRASTESLGQLGDPAAIPPLNELLLRETSGQLPEAVIRHAINSIAVTEARSPTKQQTPALPVVAKPAATSDAKMQEPAATPNPKKQKHEIFAEYLSSFEPREGIGSPASDMLAPHNDVDKTLDATEERLRREEEALRKAAEALDQKRLEAAAARRIAEDEARIKSEREAQARMEVEARIRAEEEARRRMAEEAARKRAEEETRIRTEQEAQSRAEEEARRRAEEEAQTRATEEARLRAAIEARIRAEEEAKHREEEELRAGAAAEAHRAAEDARVRREAEERHRVEEARLLADQYTLMQVAAELSRRRSELEEARQKAEEEARLLVDAQERAKDRKSTRLNSSHDQISYAVFCLR